MGKHSGPLTDEKRDRIINLLATTEMTISQISDRMAVSDSTIRSVNRRFQIRDYKGMRASWAVRSEKPED